PTPRLGHLLHALASRDLLPGLPVVHLDVLDDLVRRLAVVGRALDRIDLEADHAGLKGRDPLVERDRPLPVLLERHAGVELVHHEDLLHGASSSSDHALHGRYPATLGMPRSWARLPPRMSARSSGSSVRSSTMLRATKCPTNGPSVPTQNFLAP